MKIDSTRLQAYLNELARTASPGDRLPTVRALMAQFSVSQAVVQRATERLKAEGQISAETGRGTFFVGGQGSAIAAAQLEETGPEGRSVLVLRRSTSIRRGRQVLEILQSELQAAGCRVVEVSYTDSRDGMQVLRTLPRFSACLLQSSFETISIEMLHAIKLKTGTIIVDGAVLAGTEVDAVGVEWGTPIDMALARLRNQQHRDIGLITTAHFLLATELGKLRFAATNKGAPNLLIEIPAWPHENYMQMAIDRILAARRSDGSLPFSALIVWGIEDGRRFRALLEQGGVSVPGDLSIILLGRTDLPNEHADFFDCVGPSTQQQAQAMLAALNARWTTADHPYRTNYLQTTLIERSSVGLYHG